MLKTILLICAIVCLAHSEGADWINWNNYAAANPTLVSYQYTLPPNFSRYVDNSATQSNYNTRANQYKYIWKHPIFGTTCSFWCGLRSFLTLDQNGNLICQRDYSQTFWGQYSTNYGPSCIPDVEKTSTCVNNFRTLASVGNCDMNIYSNNNAYGDYQCCYNDNNGAPHITDDLTTKLASTVYLALRNHE